MAYRRPRYYLIDLVLIIALCALIAAAGRWAWGVASLVRKFRPLDEDTPLAIFGFTFAFTAWSITWSVVRGRRASPRCDKCGRRFFQPRSQGGPTSCPECLQAFSTAGPRDEQSRGIRTLFYFRAVCYSFVVLGLVVALGFSDYIPARFRLPNLLALPLLIFVGMLGVFVVSFIGYVLFVGVRDRVTLGGGRARARARKVAGKEGEESSLGPIRLWYSGPTDPSPMLGRQMEVARSRLAAMLGEAVEVRNPLRVLCFERRDALVAFHRQASTSLWNFDGVYAPAPARLLTLTTEVVPHRLADPEETARSVFSLALLEEFKGFLPAPWLQSGINSAVTSGPDGLDRLHRQMVASIARGTTLGDDLFRMDGGKLFKLLTGWRSFENHARGAQFKAQSRSLVEYLIDEGTAGDLGGRFRSYIHALRKGQPDEPVFRDHLGCGYDGLLERWRDWVSSRDVAPHAPPPPRIRDALQGRVIPILLDRGGKVMDRILAVRALGREGYVPGADALIDLLRDPGEIPKEEVAWSLESISGMALGEDPDRWAAWWDGLPTDIREGRGLQPDHVGSGEIPAPIPGDARG